MNNCKICYLFFLMLIFSSCSNSIWQNSLESPIEVYDEFWTHLNENYIYFEEKQVDWQEIGNIYRQELNEESSEEELLSAMESAMLTLRDAHNYIRTDFRNGKVYDYREGVVSHFSLEVISEEYLNLPVEKEGSFYKGRIGKNVVYVHVPKMENIHALQELLRMEIGDHYKGSNPSILE